MTHGINGAGGRRRALLIGVTETPSLQQVPDLAKRFRPLSCADQDVTLIAKALEQSRYEVSTYHPGHRDPLHRHVGRGTVLGRLHDLFVSCEPGDTAFVYLSCHGESVNGRDYLVLADAQPGALHEDGTRGLLHGTLLAADPGDLLNGLKPGVTAVICLDMCRTAGARPAAEVEETLLVAGREDVFWLHSCSPGQQSFADATEGSYFGRALGEALSPTSPPTTFGDIVEYTRKTARRLARDLPHPAPDIQQYLPHQRRETATELVLCDGSQETLRWTRSITESGLWEHTSGSPDLHERVKARLTDLVLQVAEARSGAGAHLDDPWGDPAFPVRVERQLADLVRRASLHDMERLSPAETAVLLAAPVVYEGAVAVALGELAVLFGDRVDAVPAPDSQPCPLSDHQKLVRSGVTDVCRAHSRVQRTTEALGRRRLAEAALAADHWLRHRYIADWDRLWERTGDYPSVDGLVSLTVDAVIASAEDLTARVPTESDRHGIDRQVRQVLGHLTVRPGSSPRINEAHQDDDWSNYPPVRGSQWRGRDLAHLLWTAGLLAADPRRMSSVLIDHLAAHKPLVPRDVVAALSSEFGYEDTRAAAESEEYGLAVRFRCPHPALHAAIEELAGSADASVRSLHGYWKKKRGTNLPALLRGVPVEVTTEHLVPHHGEYTKPLERLRLAEDEIRPLLMGTPLYGDRTLAVRELYQNALDACRYRDMRTSYGIRRGRPDPEWRGRITFTQGWDEEGRPYIQCEDNGIGMSREKLTSMFARAGKRYEQDPDFVQERRNWRRYGIEDVAMNSRFGIGVFSYFMLAEEVVVWTGPVDFHGLPVANGALRADIHAGSNLLQIRPAADAPVSGGTRVRLYLTARDEPLPSLVDTLKSLLWVSDYEVTAEEFAEEEPGRCVRSSRWRPGVLRPRQQRYDQMASGADTWLVQGPGRLLFDGVTIKDSPVKYGYVFNLREAHSPELSVNRNQLISYDEGKVMGALLDSVPVALEGCAEVSLNWLWALAPAEPRLALRVLEELAEDTMCVLEEDEDFEAAGNLVGTFLLSEVGCLPFDKSIRERGSHFMDIQTTLSAWRKTLLSDPWQEPFQPRGYPSPAPLDFVLFPERAPVGDWEGLIRAAASLDVPLSELVRALRRYAIAGVTVPAVADIRALRSVAIGTLEAHLHAAYKDAAGYQRRGLSPATHAPLVMVSGEYDVTLEEALEALRTLRSVDTTLPPAPQLEPGLIGERFSMPEVQLIAGSPPHEEEQHSWVAGEVCSLTLIQRADDPATRAHLAQRLKHLAALGFSLDDEPSDATLNAPPLSSYEKDLLSEDIDAEEPWCRGTVPITHVLRCSADKETTVGAVVDTINRLSEVTGVRAPELSGIDPEAEAPAWASFGGRSRGEPDRRIGPWEVVDSHMAPRLRRGSTSRPQPKPRTSLAAELELLEACGMLTPDCRSQVEVIQKHLTQVTALFQTAASSRSVGSGMSRDMFNFLPALDQDGATLAVMTAAAAHHAVSLGEIVIRFGQLPAELPLEVAKVPPAALALRPTMDQLGLLLDTTVRSIRFKERLTIAELLAYCESRAYTLGWAVDAIAAYSALGAPPVPGGFTGDDATALADLIPTALDHAAFDEDLITSDALGPLELVRIAGRFDWTLAAAYARYAPYRCLGLEVTVSPPTPQEAALVPDWRDVVILTRQLTGRAPALTGTVDPDHVVLCAEETDLSEAEVLERLGLYANLFSLTLPSTESQNA